MCLTILLVFSCLYFAFIDADGISGGPCPLKDDMGSSLIGEGLAISNLTFTCSYEEAGVCKYFVDGSLSSGASACPNALLQTGLDIPVVSLPVHKPNNVPIIAGSIVGAMVVIAAVMGALIMIQRRRRTRTINLEISRYDASVAENMRIRPSSQFCPSHLDIPVPNLLTQSHFPKDRQSLQAQALQIERQIAGSEAVLNGVDASPEFTRALMTENVRLNTEIQALRELNRSDWAQGLTDVAPPSYPHTQTREMLGSGISRWGNLREVGLVTNRIDKRNFTTNTAHTPDYYSTSTVAT
ncbi:hypothetical protein C8J56DRAFT_902213 [Mycena floridula]|nr:hypothetical protein C8J56DRAFT_902213 [Mycena floridula]